jgi:hypothetical protein
MAVGTIYHGAENGDGETPDRLTVKEGTVQHAPAIAPVYMTAAEMSHDVATAAICSS